MVFDHDSPITGPQSRDLDLSPADYSSDLILEEQFEAPPAEG